jgi:hypothetical protein
VAASNDNGAASGSKATTQHNTVAASNDNGAASGSKATTQHNTVAASNDNGAASGSKATTQHNTVAASNDNGAASGSKAATQHNTVDASNDNGAASGSKATTQHNTVAVSNDNGAASLSFWQEWGEATIRHSTVASGSKATTQHNTVAASNDNGAASGSEDPVEDGKATLAKNAKDVGGHHDGIRASFFDWGEEVEEKRALNVAKEMVDRVNVSLIEREDCAKCWNVNSVCEVAPQVDVCVEAKASMMESPTKANFIQLQAKGEQLQQQQEILNVRQSEHESQHLTLNASVNANHQELKEFADSVQEFEDSVEELYVTHEECGSKLFKVIVFLSTFTTDQLNKCLGGLCEQLNSRMVTKDQLNKRLGGLCEQINKEFEDRDKKIDDFSAISKVISENSIDLQRVNMLAEMFAHTDVMGMSDFDGVDGEDRRRKMRACLATPKDPNWDKIVTRINPCRTELIGSVLQSSLQISPMDSKMIRRWISDAN